MRSVTTSLQTLYVHYVSNFARIYLNFLFISPGRLMSPLEKLGKYHIICHFLVGTHDHSGFQKTFPASQDM